MDGPLAGTTTDAMHTKPIHSLTHHPMDLRRRPPPQPYRRATTPSGENLQARSFHFYWFLHCASHRIADARCSFPAAVTMPPSSSSASLGERACLTRILFSRHRRALIHTHLLSAARLPPLLRALRSALAPGNAFAPPRAAPPEPEQAALRRRAAERIVEALPPHVVRLIKPTPRAASRPGSSRGKVHYDGSDEKAVREAAVNEVHEVLGVLADQYLNRHVVFGIVELLVVRLMPEMAERGVEALMAERLGT
ncbi:hypothetical protein BDY21DRAFT_422699 [Lineolata rhizophorae]|uniref:PXA domain-containing protein n=1 Tax=Lineolata rhizophorae TaxID=578093 RepID=A0A6A6NXA7_9PEZI|nr:hypothetical protein BDY21DRAFT_422699 [Lineolata rhizophorae]